MSKTRRTLAEIANELREHAKRSREKSGSQNGSDQKSPQKATGGGGSVLR